MSWVKLDFFRFASGARPRELRAVVVAIGMGELDAGTVDAWRCGRGDVLERAVRLDLQKVDGLPDGFEVLAIWDELRWRQAFVMISHPSFEPVREGYECPRFVAMTDLLREAGDASP